MAIYIGQGNLLMGLNLHRNRFYMGPVPCLVRAINWRYTYAMLDGLI